MPASGAMSGRFERLHQRTDPSLGIGLDVQIGNLATLPQPPRLGIDLNDPSIRIEVAALRRVIAQRRTHADHEIGVREQFPCKVVAEGAGDADVEGMAVEHALGEQTGSQQCSGGGGQRTDLGAGSRSDGTAAGDDNRAAGRSYQLDGCLLYTSRCV